LQQRESASALASEPREDAYERDPAGLLRISPSLTAILRWRADHQAERLAYVFLEDGEVEAASLTYGRLDARARVLAKYLLDQGASGERALLLYPPGLDFLVALFACFYAGVVAVPLYAPRPNRRDPRIVDIARDADSRFALTTKDVAANLSRALKHSPELGELLWCATDEIPDEPTLGAFLGEGRNEHRDLAYLQYTSGSTRSPKGAMVTHGNLLAQLEDLELSVCHPPESVFVTWLPHFHDMGLVSGLLVPLCLGFPCYFMPPASFLQHPARWLNAISRYRATHSGAPNFAYELCCQRVTPEQKGSLDLSRWTVAFTGAEPVRAKTLHAFASEFASCGFSRAALCPAYGLAEATLKVTMKSPGRELTVLSLRPDELSRDRVVVAEGGGLDTRTLVGCGGPAATEILIVNPETHIPCGADEVGEIWLRGPSIAQGYWRRPEESRETFYASPSGGNERKRYLRTGDLGFLREGELFVTGRLKDLVIIRGRNHYPQDIELTVEGGHPAFRPGGAAAFSLDVEDEERLVVVQEVDRHYRDLDVGEVASAVRQRIADEHELSPYAIVLVRQNGIPKTSSGKVQRQACARAFVEGSLPVTAEWREERSTDARELAGNRPPSRKGAPTQEDIEAFVSRRLSTQLGIPPDEIDLRQPFSALGLDSQRALSFLGELETWLGRRLSPTLFWNYPTVAALAKHLDESSSAAGPKRPERPERPERKVTTWNP
jgi:acyl-CoA synthetase (AMP-forming)/AMP-acid ligase II/acyl carrier protein